jgi:hypothetical protein
VGHVVVFNAGLGRSLKGVPPITPHKYLPPIY